MPIYEYRCNNCGNEFEEIVKSKDLSISCPECCSTDTAKLLSAFSFKSSGSTARTSTAASSCSSCSSKNCSTCS